MRLRQQHPCTPENRPRSSPKNYCANLSHLPSLALSVWSDKRGHVRVQPGDEHALDQRNVPRVQVGVLEPGNTSDTLRPSPRKRSGLCYSLGCLSRVLAAAPPPTTAIAAATAGRRRHCRVPAR